MKAEKSKGINTKARILMTSLHLFNKLGLSKVTLRTIAKEMNISQGNLNYHFKKRKDILEALYFQLVELMNSRFEQVSFEEISLKSSFENIQVMMHNFYDYRFFMLDFVQIMRENERISKHYRQLVELRQKQFLGLFKLLENEGLIRSEEIEGEYLHLYTRMNIMGDFWLSSAICTQELSPVLIDKYSRIIFMEFYPYLTLKGKEQFREIID